MDNDWADLASDLTELVYGDDKPSDDKNAGKTVRVKQTINRHVMRRVTSELALEKELPWHFEQGASYHCLSWGDVDSLTYFRAIVKQQHIRYAFISTWCMASEDIAEIRQWIQKGYIDRVDFYIGEIFKASYRPQYNELIALSVCSATIARLWCYSATGLTRRLNPARTSTPILGRRILLSPSAVSWRAGTRIFTTAFILLSETSTM